MTKKELSQLYYLGKEIELEQERLEKLRSAAMAVTGNISGAPSSNLGNKTSIAAEIVDCENLIRAKREASVAEYNRISRYIASVEDSFIRQIFVLRYIDCLSWRQVAQRIGGNNTEDSIRMAHNRFLEQR